MARTQTVDAEVETWASHRGCCDDCKERDGTVIRGENGPPLHPNCRCDSMRVRSSSRD